MRYIFLVSPLLVSLVLGLSAQGQGRPQILPMPPQDPLTPNADAPAPVPDAAPPATPELGGGPQVLPQAAPAPTAPLPDAAPPATPEVGGGPQVLPQAVPAPIAPSAAPTSPLPFGQGSALGVPAPQAMPAPQMTPSPEALAADPVRIADLAEKTRGLLAYALAWPSDLGTAVQTALSLAQPPITARGEGWEQMVLTGVISGLTGGCERVTGKLMTELRSKGALDEGRDWAGYPPEVVAAITRGGFLYDMPPEASEGVSCAIDLGPTALALGPQGLELQAMAEEMRLHFDPVDLRGVVAGTGLAAPFGELPKAIGRGLREGTSSVLQAAVMAVAGQSPSDPYHWRLEIALWRAAP